MFAPLRLFLPRASLAFIAGGLFAFPGDLAAQTNALARDREFDHGSGIALERLDSVQVQNLATLARVWGFLKYHHPNVTAGKLHWDYELLRVMPDVLAAPDCETVNARLLRWVNSLGPIAAPPPLARPVADVHLRSDLAWLNDGTLGAPLRHSLERIRRVHFGSSRQFYVSLAPGIGNPVFNHEPNYASVSFPDAGFQLLGLFRYWNMIQYWFPYRDLLDADWHATLEAFIPRIGLARTSEGYALEFMSLIASVGDTHANLWGSLHQRPPVGDSQLPIALRFVEGRAVVTDLIPLGENQLNPFRRGDVILAIGERPVAELIDEWRPYYAASNEPTRLRDIARFMTRGPAGPVALRIRRDDSIIDLHADRLLTSSLPALSLWHDLPGPPFRLLTPEIAYLKLSAVDPGEIEGYLARAESTKGWIVDLRNYPSKFVVFALGALFVDRPTDFARFTRGSVAEPGTFVFTDCLALRSSPPQPVNRPRLAPPTINLDTTTFADRPDFPFQPSPTARMGSVRASSLHRKARRSRR